MNGNILDFGCGPGFLLEKLLARGIPCRGADFSEQSITKANSRLDVHALFQGIDLMSGLPLAYRDDLFDVVFLIEVIEHMLENELAATMAEVHRILKKGGHIAITTPNQENLEEGTILCPECGCIFHRLQHVRSWSVDSLSSFMAGHGFRAICCKTVTLLEDDVMWRSLGVRLWNVFSRAKKPNLIYVGVNT